MQGSHRPRCALAAQERGGIEPTLQQHAATKRHQDVQPVPPSTPPSREGSLPHIRRNRLAGVQALTCPAPLCGRGGATSFVLSMHCCVGKARQDKARQTATRAGPHVTRFTLCSKRDARTVVRAQAIKCLRREDKLVAKLQGGGGDVRRSAARGRGGVWGGVRDAPAPCRARLARPARRAAHAHRPWHDHDCLGSPAKP